MSGERGRQFADLRSEVEASATKYAPHLLDILRQALNLTPLAQSNTC